MGKYTIGIDFGSLSGRAVLSDTATGREVAAATLDYPHAVMDTHLTAAGDIPLPADFALQDPRDYLLVLETTLPRIIGEAGISPDEVVGIAVDFTCCTLLPVDEDGLPLCAKPEFAANPYAYVMLWKHHAAQKYADRMNEIARQRGEKFLDQVGGTISSEWMFPKICQVLEEAPEVYRAARYFMEAGDWITWMLCGTQTRGYQFAAYKSLYVKGVGYPSEDFFAAVHPDLRFVVRDKLIEPTTMLGDKVGNVCEKAASAFGLSTQTAVGAPVPDAHVAALALGVKEKGDMFAVLGTSGCFFLVGDRNVVVPGICGTVPDGILPGLYGFEAGLCCLGDHFAFAAEKLTSPAYVKEAAERGIPMLRLLIEKAAQRKPGESGVIALNWFNGNRSTLVDSALSGLFVGLTLTTAPEDLMRALIEATAFGWRTIVEAFEACGVAVENIIASGGIARKDPFTMQLYADVLGRDIAIAETAQAPAMSASIGAAVAAGVYPNLHAASTAMASKIDRIFHPVAAHTAIYDQLYAEYMTLRDYFGKGGNDVMHRLRTLATRQKGDHHG